MSYTYDHEIDEDLERIKIKHYAVSSSGNRVLIDHSPYEEMTDSAFQAHVILGFPCRPTIQKGNDAPVSVPWRNNLIIEAVKL